MRFHSSHPSASLTEGSISQGIIAFALPLFLGNLFQQLYNTADSLIVGNFLGSEALAAVSSSGNLSPDGRSGQRLSMGAGVVIARYYGARDRERYAENPSIPCSPSVSSAGSAADRRGHVALAHHAQGSWVRPKPFSRIPSAISERISPAPSPSSSIISVWVSFRRPGDSKHPLQYLIISSFVNIALDLLFVGVFHMGVGSAAAATAISQLVSMLLCMARLIRSERDYHVDVRKIRFEKRALVEILQNGLPAGLQNSIISIANVVVQSNINAFGAAAMAGCGAHSRIEGFGFLPVTCFTMALTTFVSQNLGAKQYDRVKKGIRFGIGCSAIIAETVALLIFCFSPTLIGLFTNDAESIAYGVLHERTTTPFFFLLAYSHCMAAIFRGAGKSTVPMLVMLLCWCIIRVAYVTGCCALLPRAANGFLGVSDHMVPEYIGLYDLLF